MVRFFAAFLLLLVGTAAAPPAAPVPPQHYTAPGRAADHVAEVVIGEGLGPRQQGRARIMRHHNWLREEKTVGGRASIAHSDFATGTSFTYARDARGHYSSVWIIRVASTTTRQRYHRVRTGRRNRALSERCEIWNTREIGAGEGEGPNALSCDTTDGVTLWTRTESARSGTAFGNSRTLSFARRPVAARAAAPPRDLFRLDFWLGPQTSVSPAQTDYRVELATRPGAGGRVARRILQRHGDWRSTDRRQPDGSRLLSMQTRTARFGFEQEANGRPVMLSASVLPPGQSGADQTSWLSMPERRAETVLGERCRWMRPATMTHDWSYSECRAGDGVPLRIEEGGRGGGALLTATSVSRRRLSPAAFAPPPAAVSWAAWGVPGRP